MGEETDILNITMGWMGMHKWFNRTLLFNWLDMPLEEKDMNAVTYRDFVAMHIGGGQL